MPELVNPTRTHGLVDILDRVLDKGLVIAGDIKINLANVELLTHPCAAPHLFHRQGRTDWAQLVASRSAADDESVHRFAVTGNGDSPGQNRRTADTIGERNAGSAGAIQVVAKVMGRYV